MPQVYKIDGHAFQFDQAPTPEQVTQLRQQVAAQAQPATPQASGPGFGTDLASAGLQAATGAALAPAIGPGAIPVAMAAGAIPYAIQRGGMPSVGEGLGIALGEALPFAKRIPGVGPMIERAGAKVGEVAGPVLGRMMAPWRRPAAQALEASGLVQDAARGAVGTIQRRPTAIAGEILNKAKGLMRGATEQKFSEETASDITRTTMRARKGVSHVTQEVERSGTRQLEPTMKQALGETLDTFGVDLTKMNEREFLQLVRESPERAAAAIQAFETASEERLIKPGDLQRLWVADVLHGSAAPVRAGVPRATKGLLTEPGSAYVLDGKVISDAWRALTPEGRLTFGPDAAKALDGLVAKLDALPKAARGIRQLTGQKMPLTAPIAAFMRVAGSQGAKVAGLGLGAAAAELLPHIPGGKAATIGAGLVLGKRGARMLVDRMLGTPEGVRWLTSGVEQIGRGLPTVMVADTMSRMLMRSPQLMASLGLSAANSGPLPGQQAAFAGPPGLAMPGMGQ